jgi:hypothetical protein
MDVKIEVERPEDADAIREVVRTAFDPDHSVAAMVDAIRRVGLDPLSLERLLQLRPVTVLPAGGRVGVGQDDAGASGRDGAGASSSTGRPAVASASRLQPVSVPSVKPPTTTARTVGPARFFIPLRRDDVRLRS